MRRYAVIAGLGATGLSCARYLRAHGWRLALTDTRAAPPQLAALTALDPGIPVSLGLLDPALLEGATLVVSRPACRCTGLSSMRRSAAGSPSSGTSSCLRARLRLPW